MRGLTHFCLLIFGAIIAENSLLLQVVVVTNCRLVLGEMEKNDGSSFFLFHPKNYAQFNKTSVFIKHFFIIWL